MSNPPWLGVTVLPSADRRTLNLRFRFRWWRPSFWRMIRDHIDVSPRWLAWPMALWIVVGFALSRRRA